VDLDLATGISSSKLTGALPALDGSSLTGVGVTGITSSANATAITISSGEDVTLTNALTIQNARSTSSGDGSLIFDPSDSTVSYSIRQQTGDELVFETYASSAWSDILRFTSDGRGLSQFTAKSWVNFSGENVLTVRDSHNVSSVTDRGVGEYTMNFSNNMANDDYAAAGLPRYDFVGGVCYFETLSVSNITLVNINNLDALADSSTSTVIIFGD
jgi:hypothetical protein